MKVNDDNWFFVKVQNLTSVAAVLAKAQKHNWECDIALAKVYFYCDYGKSTKETILQALDKTDLNNTEIGRCVNVTKAYVTQLKKDKDKVIQRSLSETRWVELLELHKQNKYTITELANKFNISRAAIYGRLKTKLIVVSTKLNCIKVIVINVLLTIY